MWQRFTERARRVVFNAQEEAVDRRENYVSTEHLLLGLARENDCVAARILDYMGVSLEKIRSELNSNLGRGNGRPAQDTQLTPGAKRCIDFAYDEARRLSNNYIGTEHLLLGLVREALSTGGLASQVLSNLSIDLEKTRKEVIKLQDNDLGLAMEKAANSVQLQYVHLNGRLVPKSQAMVSIYDHGFLYGDGAFEGIRVYSGNIFRLKQHVARLFASARALGISLGKSAAFIQAAIVETVIANGVESGYIRVSVSRGVGLALDPAHLRSDATIVISTEELRLYSDQMYKDGLTVITASTRVPPADCIDPQVKSLGKYLNNIAAKQEANRVGAGEALMLNMSGNVAEATGDNLFLVRDGALSTPPTSEGALPGITRGAVIDICSNLGISCVERVTTLYDVYNADEAFLTGTAAEIIPMVKCDGRLIGDGRPGPITNRIISAFRELTPSDGVRAN